MFINKEIADFLSEEKWLVCQENYAPELNLNYETNFTLSNGYMGTRGSFEVGAGREHPGSFIAGVFNTSEEEAKTIVNIPNWLGLKIYIGNKPLSLDSCEILEFKRILDMRKSLLFKKMKVRDLEGRETLIEGFRFLSRNNVHRAGIRMHITPLNYSGKIYIESIIDGTVTNTAWNPVQRVKHLKLVENSGLSNKGCYLEMVTRDADMHIGIGTSLKAFDAVGKENIACSRKSAVFGEQASELCGINAVENVPITVNKYIVTYTSKESGKSRLKAEVAACLDEFVFYGMDEELEKHIRVYERLWRVSNIDIKGDEKADKYLRFCIFHLMSTLKEDDPMVNIGAKGLHGEGYKGMTFWDTEIYLLPFFLYTRPEAARTLLMYRYNMLDGARRNADLNGMRGAKYPWNSADTGDEDSVLWAVNIAGNRIRFPAETQIHVVAAVAYGVIEYFRVTDDNDFMLNFGAEMLFEIARYWESRTEYNSELDRYDIRNVIGPDEFHLNIDNNFYTNYLIKWSLSKALELIEGIKNNYPLQYRNISSRLCLTPDEIQKWKKVEAKIYIPFDREKKLIEQFEGYFSKKDYTITEYDKNNMPLWPKGVDVENLSETQLIKQADVIMLLLLLKHEFDEDTKIINYEYYTKRTMHKSTLSASSYALMGLQLCQETDAYDCFIRSAETDLVDSQGSTWEGLHIAACGGTWQTAVFGFAGLQVDREGVLYISPRLPNKWEKMTLKVAWRGNLFEVDINRNKINCTLLEGNAHKVRIKELIGRVEIHEEN